MQPMDGNLGLLSGERTSPQASSDQCLVPPDGGFDQSPLTIAGNSLPSQPTVACDRHNVLVPLTAFDRGGMVTFAVLLCCRII